ncbi:alpha/beta hydrolase [Actinocorallia lasiicapitis]
MLVSSGLGGAWFDWDAVVGLLPRARVLVFDRPGLGASPASPQIPSLRREVDLLRALAERAGAPVVLVAHSMAAFHAEAFARIFPELVRALVLVDPSCEEHAPPRTHLTALVAPAAGLAGRALEITRLPRLCAPWGRRSALRLVSAAGDRTTPPEIIRAVYGRGAVWAAMLAENTAYPEMAADLLALRARHPFPKIPLEVITALGDLDQDDAWPALHQRLAALSPNGRQTLLPRSRHMVMLDAPDAVAQAVRRVLS